MNVYIGIRLPSRVENTGEIAAAIALADHVTDVGEVLGGSGCLLELPASNLRLRERW
jgi:hypothetical protein